MKCIALLYTIDNNRTYCYTAAHIYAVIFPGRKTLVGVVDSMCPIKEKS